MELSDNSPWKVGVLFSQSGVTSTVEKTQLNGTLLAIRELNEAGGILGREIKPVIYDPASNPEQHQKLAEKLLCEDDVKVIFGCYMSSTRKAVLSVIEKHNGLLFYPTLYEGFEFSNNIIYTGAAPNQNSIQLADFMMNEGGKRVYMVGSNYVYPYESNRIMKDYIRQNRGTVVEERYLSLEAGEKDFIPIIDEIKAKEPSFIFSTVVGASTAFFYQAYAEAGLDPATMPIVSLTTSEAEIMEMGIDVARGHITSAPYFETIESDVNNLFVKNYRKEFGPDAPITSGSESAYYQVRIMAKGLEQVGMRDTKILRAAVLGSEYEAPQGRIRIDPDNNHTYLWPRVGRVNAQGKFDIIGQTFSSVKPDPYLVFPHHNDWSMQHFHVHDQKYVQVH